VSGSSKTLPSDFTTKSAKGAGFAGGVEMAFMSTTCDPQIALDFSGGPDKKGSIFEIKFTAASRGVDVQLISLWPPEKELLYAPLTYLTCQDTKTVGEKKLIKLDATMSTARPNLEMVVLQMDLDKHCEALPLQPCETCRRPRAVDRSVKRVVALEQQLEAIEVEKEALRSQLRRFQPTTAAM
jgi:hypothetical protein